MNKKKAIATRIKDALDMRGISQTEFATLMGATDSVISRLLSGTHNPTLKSFGIL